MSLSDFVVNSKGVLEKYNGTDNDVVIPDGVICIGYRAFCGCRSVVSVTVPSPVSSIGESAFSDCANLRSINLPNSLISIESCAFRNCYSLENIVIPDSVTKLGHFAFAECIKLRACIISNKLKAISRFTFDDCKSLEAVLIPNTVEAIGTRAFSGCYKLTIFSGKSSYAYEYARFMKIPFLPSEKFAAFYQRVLQSIGDDNRNDEKYIEDIEDSTTVDNEFVENDNKPSVASRLVKTAVTGGIVAAAALLSSQKSKSKETKADIDESSLDNSEVKALKEDNKFVFISYSSKETSLALKVKKHLENNGISCWMAPESIPGGSDYASEIPKAISECRVVLLILSEASQGSPWVQKEIKNAIDNFKKIIPFHTDNAPLSGAYNFMLCDYQRIEAFNRFDEAYAELVTTVKRSFDIE